MMEFMNNFGFQMSTFFRKFPKFFNNIPNP